VPGACACAPELRKLPLLFRETFRTRAETLKNGASLVGSGTSWPAGGGVTFNGSGNLSYTNLPGPAIFGSAVTYKAEFTIGFVPGDAAIHYVFRADDAADTANYSLGIGTAGELFVYAGAAAVLSLAYGVWSPFAVVGKNVLVVSSTTGDTKMWLNGTMVGSGGAAWTAKRTSVMAIGARHTNVTRWTGTIYSLEIYGSVATSIDEPLLRQGNLVEGIDFSQALSVLPLRGYYKRASDGLYVTDVEGKGTVTQALMGSDGSTTTQFPSIIKPNGASFDGGDQINLGDSDQYSFTDGVSDKPFSIAMLCRDITPVAGGSILAAKATASNVGEYQLFILLLGVPRLYFTLIDNAAAVWSGIYGKIPFSATILPAAIVATSNGLGPSGNRLYINGVRIDTIAASSGAYSRMQNTAAKLTLGGPTSTYLAISGKETLPSIWDKELSPAQVRALSARYMWEARRM
jgi:hypothetical protein